MGNNENVCNDLCGLIVASFNDDDDDFGLRLILVKISFLLFGAPKSKLWRNGILLFWYEIPCS